MKVAVWWQAHVGACLTYQLSVLRSLAHCRLASRPCFPWMTWSRLWVSQALDTVRHVMQRGSVVPCRGRNASIWWVALTATRQLCVRHCVYGPTVALCAVDICRTTIASPAMLLPVQKLEAVGQLDNTYIVYVSDNGYHLGNHMIAKVGALTWLAYRYQFYNMPLKLLRPNKRGWTA